MVDDLRCDAPRHAEDSTGTALFPSWIILLVVVLVTFSAFRSTLGSDFVNWDDPGLLLENLEYRGLGWTHLQWMFTTTLLGHWVPLTWMTFGLDYVLWGMNPFGYHLTNLLLHIGAVVAFYFVALRLLRAAMTAPSEMALRLGAGAAALFFAIHPLRVESVAWITERRDVLSGLFFMLTIIAYLKAAALEDARRRWWLAGSVGCYLLAVLSKAIVMTMPLVLILLDFYPLRRVGGGWRDWLTLRARRIWREKIPYFVFALVAGGMAAYAQRTIVAPLASWSLASRIGVAFYGVWFYVQKTVVPYPIWPLYEIYPENGPLSPAIVGSAIGVIALCIAFFLARRRWPGSVAVWVSYVVLLAPVLGLTQAGPQLVAPRYSYLACLGWALLVGGASCLLVERIARELRVGRAAGLAAGVVAGFAGLTALTRNQAQVWRNSETLWSYAIAVDPKSEIAHGNLGSFLLNRGRVDEAEAHIKKAVELRPNNKNGVWNMGILALRGRLNDSVRTDVAFKLVKQRDFGRAAELFQKAVEERPGDATAHNNLGVALFYKGDTALAIEQFERALKINPAFEEAKLNLTAARKR